MAPSGLMLRLTRTLPVIVAALAFAIGATARPASAQIGLETVVPLELRGPVSGIIVGIISDGEFALLQSFGSSVLATDAADSAAVATTDSLQIDAVFPFPWGTQMLLGVTARALASQNLLGLDVPISAYLTELRDTELGSATVSQLLMESAGLPDLSPPPNMSWTQLMDRAAQIPLVAAPGSAYSRSRLSYPLVARVLERVVGLPINEVLTAAVLSPLGMVQSSFSPITASEQGQLIQGYEMPADEVVPVPHVLDIGGLPVLYTSMPDLMTFVASWMAGDLRGASPVQADPWNGEGLMGNRLYVDGMWYESGRQLPRVSLRDEGVGFGVGLDLYPESGVALAVVANGQLPTGVLSWAESEVEVALMEMTATTVADDAAAPAAEVAEAPAEAATASADEPAEPPLPADLPDWIGTFENGGAAVTLELDDEGNPVIVRNEDRIPLLRLDERVWGLPTPAGLVAMRLTRVDGQPVVFTGGAVYRRLAPNEPQD